MNIKRYVKRNIGVVIGIMCTVSLLLIGTEYYSQSKSITSFHYSENSLPVTVKEIKVNDEVIDQTIKELTTQQIIDKLEDLYTTYGISSYKENIVMIGEISDKLNHEERMSYAESILNTMEAKQTGYYKEKYEQDSEAYYGYTKKIKTYFLDDLNQKNNIQISFYYDETIECTKIIIALPFYNDLF